MRVRLPTTLLLARLAMSGPTRRDCGQTKCYDAVNGCGMTYGGCWTVECSGGMTEMPTFTAPLCPSGNGTDSGYPMQTSTTEPVASSPTDDTEGPLITPPPSTGNSTRPTPTQSTGCKPLWLCVDYLAVCGDLQQWYGGCYDTCTSAPPFQSPPCSLSSITSDSSPSTSETPSSTSTLEYAAPTSSPHAATAYTKNPTSENIAPVIDSSKALVMAEMPSSDAPPSIPSFTSELRVATVAEDPAPAPEPVLIETPANLRGAAIAKMQADKVRKPNVDNKPCWDKPTCREVQLRISSPVPIESVGEASDVAGPEGSVEASAEASTEPSTEAPVETSVGTLEETPVETSSPSSADATPEVPVESSSEQPSQER